VVTLKGRRCPQTHVSSFTTVKDVVKFFAHCLGTAAFSALMATPSAHLSRKVFAATANSLHLAEAVFRMAGGESRVAASIERGAGRTAKNRLE
jgi:hypothetical protein